MTQKKKIHPRVSKTSLDIGKYYGVTPAESIEQRSVMFVTNDEFLVAREKVLNERKQELEDDKKRIVDRLRKVETELEKIEELKKNFIPTQSKNFDEALHTITLRLRRLLEAEEAGKWDLQKVSLEEITMVCNEHQVTVESVLSKVPNSLKSYIQGYTVV